jgi:deoxyribodipyrimidine photolyase-related protein
MKILVLPHQLFKPTAGNEYILWEHPHYFTKYNYNKKKLILHRASMKAFADEAKKLKCKVKYYSFNQLPDVAGCHLYDPVDNINTREFKNCNLIDENFHPNFLFSVSELQNYANSHDSFYFNTFYNQMKKICRVKILEDQKSLDSENRSGIREVPEVKMPMITADDAKFIREASSYVEEKFPNNPGVSYGFSYPVMRSTVKKHFKDFLQNRLENFGTHQDAIDKDGSNLYHSILSPMINIGLLSPLKILKSLTKINITDENISSIEGYLRQLYWREYQRYIYLTADLDNDELKNNYVPDAKISNGGVFKCTEQLNTAVWYPDPSTQNQERCTFAYSSESLMLDNVIATAWNTGYLHHILRLMVVGNWMLLSHIRPHDVHRWFMEFSVDAYEWVMYQNVYDMVMFCKGVTMRKPYIASSNYWLRMSNYTRGDDAEGFDNITSMYRKFVKKHANILKRYNYRIPK